jgi:hypothetical protein
MPLQAQVCHPTFPFDTVDLPYQGTQFDFETGHRFQSASDFNKKTPPPKPKAPEPKETLNDKIVAKKEDPKDKMMIDTTK